jgi:hypothetical protein
LAATTSSAAAKKPDNNRDLLACPDAVTIDLRPNPERQPGRVRELAPSAGAQASAELYAHARLAGVAYDMYDAFTAGKDPRSAFNPPGLQLVALLYGDPGPNTERGPKRKDTTTFYGFIADETATGHRYLVFRGTEEPVEWARNIQAGQRPYPSGTRKRDAKAHVHAGFFDIFESLRLEAAPTGKRLTEALPDLVSGRDVIFVGHSLGSALATLAGVEAARIAPQSSPRLRIVTVASPRVGDPGFGAFARAVGRIDRICNMVDIVTAIPPSTRTLIYKHVGTPFRVSSYDWPQLANNLEKDGDQILCWHSDQSYDHMLDPAHVVRKPASCYRSPG